MILSMLTGTVLQTKGMTKPEGSPPRCKPQPLPGGSWVVMGLISRVSINIVIIGRIRGRITPLIL